MSVLPILRWPDPRLSEVCAHVEDPQDVDQLVTDIVRSVGQEIYQGLEPSLSYLKTSGEAEGIDRIVSLLERDEMDALGLAGEPGICAADGIAFDQFPIRDGAAPGFDAR